VVRLEIPEIQVTPEVLVVQVVVVQLVKPAVRVEQVVLVLMELD